MVKDQKKVDRMEILTATCGWCGAGPGGRCTDKRGNSLSPSQSHRDRKFQLGMVSKKGLVDPSEPKAGTNPLEEDLGEPAVRIKTPADTAKQDLKDLLDRQSNTKPRKAVPAHIREQRVDAVMFGIRISREVMKMSQHEIDRRLAEMIVDHDGDLSV